MARRYRAVIAPTAGAGSATLPVASIWSGSATQGLIIKSIELKNTTTTAARGTINRLSGGRGTVGAAITEAEFVDADTNNVSEAFNTSTVTPTTIGAAVESWAVGASIGATDLVDFSFLDPSPEAEINERGLYVPPGTTNGVGIIVIGTGQVLDVTIDFLEA